MAAAGTSWPCPAWPSGSCASRWTALIYTDDVTRVSEQAIRAAAEGERLQAAGDFEGAIEAYDEAIEESPDFAAAFARRAGARFQQGSTQIGQTSGGFISITSEEALEDTLVDVDEALGLGADSDVVTVADAGFFHFLDSDFARSAQLSEQALELNDQLASIWFNLGVAELAQGNERERRARTAKGDRSSTTCPTRVPAARSSPPPAPTSRSCATSSRRTSSTSAST